MIKFYIPLFLVINFAALMIVKNISDNVYRLSPTEDKISKFQKRVLNVFDSNKTGFIMGYLIIISIITVLDNIYMAQPNSTQVGVAISIILNFIDLFSIESIFVINSALFLKTYRRNLDIIYLAITLLTFVLVLVVPHNNYIAVMGAIVYPIMTLIQFFNSWFHLRYVVRINNILNNKDKKVYKNDKHPEKTKVVYPKFPRAINKQSLINIFNKDFDFSKYDKAKTNKKQN